MVNENDWQRQVSAFMDRHELHHDPATHALDLVSEIGELAKELLLITDYGRQPFDPTSGLLSEFGDTLYSLLALAEVCGLDPGQALCRALEKYERRLIERGEAGSL